MANFDLSFEILMRHEGGFTNSKLDMGGPTNMGITQGALAHWYNRPVTVEQIQTLDIETAKLFYKANFWELMKLDSIQNDKLAAIIFDMGVLRGPNRVIQDLQHVLGLDSDGIMGPQTIESINHSVPLNLALRLLQNCELAFVYLVQAKPIQVEFLSGWISRTHSLIDYLLFSA